ncbi:MAG: hypothetical protein EAS51_12800 [Microbacteriaceae bacterium]|nr:MAG: hypothetical protein EAS51_12800 [Microbacteriaceae bacterium]
MTTKTLHQDRTAGGFFELTLTLDVDEAGTLLSIISPHPGDEMPRAIMLNVSQAKALAEQLEAGIVAAESMTTERCSGCRCPILGAGPCAECELRTARTRRATLRIVPQEGR